MNARVLLIEDDTALSNQIADLLHDRGYQVAQHHDGQAGLLAALNHSYDVILLDVLLPKLDGFSALLKIRESRRTPVIMITACGAEEERIRGFDQGADDYLPKPFNVTELLLRIDALLRRCRGLDPRRRQQLDLIVDNLHLYRLKQSACVDDIDLGLTALQFRLLWTLIEHRGETLSKPYLYQRVLEREYSRYDRSLDMHISRIRRKLTAAGMNGNRLATLHGKGYRFQ